MLVLNLIVCFTKLSKINKKEVALTTVCSTNGRGEVLRFGWLFVDKPMMSAGDYYVGGIVLDSACSIRILHSLRVFYCLEIV